MVSFDGDLDALDTLVAKLRESTLVVNFPGWDYEFTDKDEQQDSDSVRRVAGAIYGDEEFDSGVKVEAKDIANLLAYIGQMLRLELESE